MIFRMKHLKNIRHQLQNKYPSKVFGLLFQGGILLLLPFFILIFWGQFSQAEGENSLQENTAADLEEFVGSDQAPPDKIVIDFLTQNKDLPIAKLISIQNRILKDSQWRYIYRVELINGRSALIYLALDTNSLAPIRLSLEEYKDESQVEPRLHEEKKYISDGEIIARSFLSKCKIKNLDEFKLADTPGFSEFHGGGIMFHWSTQLSKSKEDIVVFVAAANSLQGRVVYYSYNSYPTNIPSNPNISSSKAQQIFRDIAKKENKAIGDIIDTSAEMFQDPKGRESIPVWNIFFYFKPVGRGIIKENYIPGGHARIDALTGELRHFSAVNVPLRLIKERKGQIFRQANPDYTYPLDEWPTWSPEGKRLAFISNRLHYRYDEKNTLVQSRDYALFIQEGNTVTTLPLPPLISPLSPSWSPDGQKLVFESKGQIYEIDLSTRKTTVITQRSRTGSAPSWSPDGQNIVVHGERSGGDIDIFNIVRYRTSKSTKGQWRVQRQDGPDLFPVFNEDGNSIFYAHGQVGDQAGTGPSFSIWKADSNKMIWEGEAPEKVVDGLGYVFSMKAFNDRSRLLVWDSKGTHIIDTAQKTIKTLPLDGLKDPTCNNCGPLKVTYPVPGPTEGFLTFVSQKWDGDPDHEASQLIYSCRFDGTDLRRITEKPVGTVEPIVKDYFGILKP